MHGLDQYKYRVID